MKYFAINTDMIIDKAGDVLYTWSYPSQQSPGPWITLDGKDKQAIILTTPKRMKHESGV